VAHIGEELRLVLARLGKLSAFFLDFIDQLHVLYGDDSLVRKFATTAICLSVKGRTSSR
jgi:hypothetical protein